MRRGSLYAGLIFFGLVAFISSLLHFNYRFSPKSSDKHRQTLITLRTFYFCRDRVEELNWRRSKENDKKLPNQLVIPPGAYSIDQFNYEMLEEGLYRSLFFYSRNYQRIVFDHDIEKLLSSLCWLIVHGSSDDKKNYERLIEQAKSNKLGLTCSSACQFVNQVLTELKIPSRLVFGFNDITKNYYDDGHFMVEIKRSDSSNWELYDIDNNCGFKFNNQFIGLFELKELLDSDQRVELYELAKDPTYNAEMPHNKYASSYDFTFYNEVLSNGSNKLNWYKSKLQVIGIDDFATNNTPSNLTFIHRKDLKNISMQDFKHRYYKY